MANIDAMGGCLICSEKYKTMIPLQEVLPDFKKLSVVEVLEKLHFSKITDPAKLRRTLCFACVSKVQSSFEFKVLCSQISDGPQPASTKSLVRDSTRISGSSQTLGTKQKPHHNTFEKSYETENVTLEDDTSMETDVTTGRNIEFDYGIFQRAGRTQTGKAAKVQQSILQKSSAHPRILSSADNKSDISICLQQATGKPNNVPNSQKPDQNRGSTTVTMAQKRSREDCESSDDNFYAEKKRVSSVALLPNIYSNISDSNEVYEIKSTESEDSLDFASNNQGDGSMKHNESDGNQSKANFGQDDGLPSHKNNDLDRRLKNIEANSITTLDLLGKLLGEVSDLKQRIGRSGPSTFKVSKGLPMKLKEFLPLETQEAVIDFETRLAKPEHLNEFLQILHQVGGSSGKEFTERVLTAIFSPFFAQCNTWEGKKTKFNVRKTTVVRIIEEVILERFPTWDSAEFSKIGMNWFRLGNQRVRNQQQSQLRKSKDLLRNISILPNDGSEIKMDDLISYPASRI